MTDIINLNSIRSGDCDCNKPKKPICGCQHDHKPQSDCHKAIDLSDLYFKVKNLFGELKSEWLRAEARSNLGVTDIIDLEQTLASDESEGRNVWTMTIAKGGSKRYYDFVVLNGKKGDSATVEVLRTNLVGPDELAKVENVSGDDSHLKLVFYIPEGKKGEDGKDGKDGENGKSAYQLAVSNGFEGTLQLWLDSLKGEPGQKGDSSDQFAIDTIRIIRVDLLTGISLPNGTTFTGACLVYRITLKNGDTKDFWVPLNNSSNPGGGGGGNYRYNVFLFKTVSFNKVPSENELENALNSLTREVSGKTIDLLIQNHTWSELAALITQDGKQYVFMASCVVTNELCGPWSVVRLTPLPGKQGADGAQGDKGDQGEQGLIAPVIRMRGTYSKTEIYVNQTYKQYSGPNDIHYIDIVYYRDKQNPNDTGNWYAVKEGSPSDTEGVRVSGIAPTNTTYWEKAVNFDFAFIGDLVAVAIHSLSLDTSEIRIHSRGKDTDTIVAGMTSGNPVTYGDLTEELHFDNGGEHGAVRIWAGTNFNTLGNDSTFNVYDAKFRVHQNGHLYAEDADITGKVTSHDADIKGTIQANTLRLGRLNDQGKGTFELPKTNSDITLPNLPGNLTLMFYLLTNRGNTPKIKPTSGNKIQTPTGVTIQADGYYLTKLNKLYLCFGVDDTWYLVELDILAASSFVDPTSLYGLESLHIVIKDEWTKPTEQAETLTGWVLLTQNIKGTLYATFRNETSKLQTVTFLPQLIEVIYDAQRVNPDILQAPTPLSPLTTTVWYKLKVDLGTVTIPSNGLVLGYTNENYTANSPGAHIWVSTIGFNGTLSNPSNEVPAIGTIHVDYPTVGRMDIVDEYQLIILTNIPFTQNS